MELNLRIARLDDVEQITTLIQRSVRVLCASDYSEKQIEYALKTAWGLDLQLIMDGTYLVVETGEQLAACGGWSYRKTLFGNNSEENRDSSVINPKNGTAKIRAFFVDPEYSRMGLGSLIMCHCEKAARKRGYSKLELMATLPGKRLYERHGFVAGKPLEYPLEGPMTITFIAMEKEI